MFEQKSKPSRKKNLSSKIIVDEYDHLIKNSKIQPNYESFLDPPLSPHFLPKDSKFASSKQESSQSEYSMHNQNFTDAEKQCIKCGDVFSQRIYESHAKICEKKPFSWKIEEQKSGCFHKKDEYNLFSMNQSIDPENRLISARNNNKTNSKKPIDDLFESKRKVELKKSTSKKSIHSHEKNITKRPPSSTINKVELKGHQNLKEKILNKLEGTRNPKKPTQEPFNHTKRVSSSQKKNGSSNSRPKSINKNVQKFCNEQKKFSTVNSSSINKKKTSSQAMNYEFNRSEIMSGYSPKDHYKPQSKKQKVQFPASKTNIKEEKKQTLKKKNINYNNSFVSNQAFNREKEKQKSSKNFENINFSENNSYMGTVHRYGEGLNGSRGNDKEGLREELRKEGLFRRESSNSGSKRKFANNVNINAVGMMKQCERESQTMDEGSYHHHGMQQVNDQYYFFQNHPSSVPSHYIKREDDAFSRHDTHPQEIYNNYSNSTNIIRNKLGINKNFIKSKEMTAQRGKDPQQQRQKEKRSRNNNQTEQEIFLENLHKTRLDGSRRNAENLFFEKEIIHRRTNSSRENNTHNQNRPVQRQRQEKTNLNTEYMNREINNRDQRKREQQKDEDPIRNEPLFPPRNEQRRQQRPQNQPRPNNPMGNDRLADQRRQQRNRAQQRPQQRITNQRTNESQAQNTRQYSQQNETVRNNTQEQRTNPQVEPQRRMRQQLEVRRSQQSQQQQGTNNRRQNQPNGQGQSQQAQSQQQGRRRQQENSGEGTGRRHQPRRQQPQPGTRNNQRIRHQTLNFISNTLNEQFEVMNEHFNLLNNIFSNFSNIVNVNITASTSNQNPTTFVFRNHGTRRRNRHNHNNDADSSSDDTHSSYSDFSSDFSQDNQTDNETDYDQDEYYYEEEEEEENPGMTEHQINSIPVLRYNKEKHGSNQCTICLVELNQNQRFKKLFCEHVFHTQCIDEWLKRKNACPLCRDQMGVNG